MEKAEESPASKNKVFSAFISVANVIVLIVSWSLSKAYPLPACILAVVYFSIILGVTVNQRNNVRANGGDASKLSKEVKGYVAWIVFIAAILGFQVWSVGGFQAKNLSSSYQTPTELASQGAQEVKSSTTLPRELDSVTTWTDVTSDGNTVQYHYIIHDADTSNLTDSALQDAVKPNVCTNTSSKNLLSRGVNMQYFYTVKDTGQEYSFTLSQSSC